MQFEDYARKNNQHVWIVKPGEESNRGNGIEVANSIS
jgi:tubulin--tyrosine ligase